MKKTLSYILAIVVCLATLCGCGDTPGGGQTTDGPRDSVMLRNALGMQTTDPADTNETDVLTVNEQIYEGLYTLDESGGGYQPCLAKKIDISDDATVYTITLQDGVKFHNGETLKASDVVFSYQHFMDNPKYNSYTDMIEKVEALDDSHVVITIARPYSPILHTFFNIKILSEKEVTSQGSDFGTIANLAGTGPYYMDAETYRPNSGWTLYAFEDYWQGAPQIKKIGYVVIEDNSSAVIALKNGDIDYLSVPLSNWADIKDSGKFATNEMESNDIQFMCINYESSEVLNNDKVRQAIVHATNREAMNVVATDGLGKVTDFYINPHYAEAAPTECDVDLSYNPELAKSLLAEAGYPDGVDVGEILVGTGSSEPYATVLQSNLAEVGITAKITTLEFGVAVDRMASQDYNICIVGDNGNYDFNNFRQQAHSGSVGIYNVSFVGDKFDYKHIEDLFAQGEQITDEAARKEIYTELYNEVMATYCVIPLVAPPACTAWNPDLNVVNVPTYYRVAEWSWNA